MIDPRKETIFPLSQAPKHWPGSHRPSYGANYRYAMCGSHGIKLETVKLPSGLHTSKEAIFRFVEALTLAHQAESEPLPPASARVSKPKVRTAGQRERDISAAEKRLSAVGIK